jgi:hypothetical protein
MRPTQARLSMTREGPPVSELMHTPYDGPWTERPRHPRTGRPCDYLWTAPDGRRYPRWRNTRGGPKPAPTRALTAGNLAELAGVSTSTVCLRLARGWLNARRIGRRWVIPVENWRRWLRGEM